MTLHHTKHHQAYVSGLNAAEEAYAKASTPKEHIKLQAALKFNGGGAFVVLHTRSYLALKRLRSLVGHINHSLFWKNLAPVNTGGGQLHDGPLKQALERDFGSVDGLSRSRAHMDEG